MAITSIEMDWAVGHQARGVNESRAGELLYYASAGPITPYP